MKLIKNVESLIVSLDKKHVAFIIIFICFVSCIKLYSSYHASKNKKKAYTIYEQMLMSYKRKDFISAAFHANNICNNYNSTIYANISRLFLSKSAFSYKKYKTAKRYLKQIKYNSCGNILSDIVKERIVKIYLIQKKWKKSLILIDTYSSDRNKYIYEEIKGDVYMCINEMKKARQSFLNAKMSTPNGLNSYILDIKIKYLFIYI